MLASVLVWASIKLNVGRWWHNDGDIGRSRGKSRQCNFFVSFVLISHS